MFKAKGLKPADAPKGTYQVTSRTCAMPLPNDQFSLNFEEIDEDVLRPQAGLLREQFDDAGKQRLLLIHVARICHGELDQHQIIGALDI